MLFALIVSLACVAILSNYSFKTHKRLSKFSVLIPVQDQKEALEKQISSLKVNMDIETKNMLLERNIAIESKSKELSSLKENIDAETKSMFLERSIAIENKSKELAAINIQINETSLRLKDLKYEIVSLSRQKAELQIGLEATIKTGVDAIAREAAIYDETIELAEWGYYKPHFNYNDSEEFKIKIEENRTKQKNLLNIELKRMKEKGYGAGDVKLPDYAFNRACDSAIARVTWKNALNMEERINKAYDFINKNSKGIHITKDVLNLKLEELRLTHEYQQKLFEEKEEQKRIRQRMQEEEREVRAVEKARDEAEREEKEYLKELAKTKKLLEKGHAEERQNLELKILELENKLSNATEKKDRAISMAMQTKRGHVYIISNIGSFGENVYKIGMTRRLDPQDRVDELGDASVPFEFDVHGMIYSEDAPALENQLHKLFGEHTVNKINSRKEFFRVSIHEIQKECKNYGLDVELTKIAEARDYRQSLEMKNNPYKKAA